MYSLKFKQGFLDDLQKFKKSGQKKLLEKIDIFLNELEIHPKTGTGKPEQLKGFEERLVFSRRIDQKHRLVYEIIEDTVEVYLISAWGHYDEI